MKWPPYLMKLRIHSDKNNFGIWIPLFIIGPIVLVLLLAIFLLVLPFALLSIIFTWRSDWLYVTIMAVPRLIMVLWNLQGLKVDVFGEDGVEISFY